MKKFSDYKDDHIIDGNKISLKLNKVTVNINGSIYPSVKLVTIELDKNGNTDKILLDNENIGYTFKNLDNIRMEENENNIIGKNDTIFAGNNIIGNNNMVAKLYDECDDLIYKIEFLNAKHCIIFEVNGGHEFEVLIQKYEIEIININDIHFDHSIIFETFTVDILNFIYNKLRENLF
jgi:hypothetical protein